MGREKRRVYNIMIEKSRGNRPLGRQRLWRQEDMKENVS
jgi:hypothetical protein